MAIFGDSRIIIQAIIMKREPKHLLLAHSYKKVIHLMAKFKEIKIFHVLKNLNSLVDHESNKGTLLSKGSLQVNGEESTSHVP